MENTQNCDHITQDHTKLIKNVAEQEKIIFEHEREISDLHEQMLLLEKRIIQLENRSANNRQIIELERALRSPVIDLDKHRIHLVPKHPALSTPA